jgi:hypothetical protein
MEVADNALTTARGLDPTRQAGAGIAVECIAGVAAAHSRVGIWRAS